MERDFGLFVAAMLGVVVGLVVLLYGVSLNAGQSLNAVMVAGGVIGLLSILVMTVNTVRADASGH